MEKLAFHIVKLCGYHWAIFGRGNSNTVCLRYYLEKTVIVGLYYFRTLFYILCFDCFVECIYFYNIASLLAFIDFPFRIISAYSYIFRSKNRLIEFVRVEAVWIPIQLS